MNKDLEELKEEAAAFRGLFIEKTIYLERLMDNYLAEYFCETEKKRSEIVYYFLSADNYGFDKKKEIFKIIIEKQHPDLYVAMKDTFFPSLTSIIKTRNHLAHLLLDYSEKAIKKFTETREIGFIKYGESFLNSNKQVTYTVDDIYVIYHKLALTTDTLEKLFDYNS
jgi:hypothetical protein